MKIVVVSDIHPNLAAIKARSEENYDSLWCLGGLAGYGPRPHGTIRWMNTHASAIVRGTHDQAAGFNVTPDCSPPCLSPADATRRDTQEVCTRSNCEFLRKLSLRKQIISDETKFRLVHAIPWRISLK